MQTGKWFIASEFLLAATMNHNKVWGKPPPRKKRKKKKVKANPLGHNADFGIWFWNF